MYIRFVAGVLSVHFMQPQWVSSLHMFLSHRFIFQINIPTHHPAGGGGVHTSPSSGAPDDGKGDARQVDKISRKIFPTTFVIFNLIYWVVYTEPFSRDPD